MKTYSIRCHLPTHLGYIEQILGHDSKWYQACNNGGFKTLAGARSFFKNSDHALRGSLIWIRGPRGGIHKLFERK